MAAIKVTAYCDTSFLVSLYAPDANSAAAVSALKGLSGLVISSLVELEFINALNLRVFRKELTVREIEQSLKAFQDDVLSSVYTVEPMSPAVFERAKHLSMRHSSTLGVRSLDTLHVAATMVHRCDRLCTFDRSQKLLAAAAGVTVVPA